MYIDVNTVCRTQLQLFVSKRLRIYMISGNLLLSGDDGWLLGQMAE